MVPFTQRKYGWTAEVQLFGGSNVGILFKRWKKGDNYCSATGFPLTIYNVSTLQANIRPKTVISAKHVKFSLTRRAGGYVDILIYCGTKKFSKIFSPIVYIDYWLTTNRRGETNPPPPSLPVLITSIKNYDKNVQRDKTKMFAMDKGPFWNIIFSLSVRVVSAD